MSRKPATARKPRTPAAVWVVVFTDLCERSAEPDLFVTKTPERAVEQTASELEERGIEVDDAPDDLNDRILDDLLRTGESTLVCSDGDVLVSIVRHDVV